MGMDVSIAITGDYTHEQIEKFNAFLREREGQHAVQSWDSANRRESVGQAEEVEDEDGPYVDVRSLERYYSPGYERGNWPLICATIIAARHHFPDGVVRYGSDSLPGFENPEVTDEDLAETWAHWASTDGDGYHQRRR